MPEHMEGEAYSQDSNLGVILQSLLPNHRHLEPGTQ